MSKHPEVLWAQRSSPSTAEKNIIYLTVNLPDIIESSLEYDLTSTTLSFKASSGRETQTKYAFDLEFFAEVDPKNSTRHLTSRALTVVLRKTKSQVEYWPRLTKEKLKTPYIKTDFSKWVDEDEQDGNPNFDDEFAGGGMGMSGMDEGSMDFSKMMQQAGAGSDFNLGDANEVADSDSEDGGPPPLEDPESSK